MVKSERWKRNGGTDYVFYDSHPGFTAGKAARIYWGFVCHVRSLCSISSYGRAATAGLALLLCFWK